MRNTLSAAQKLALFQAVIDDDAGWRDTANQYWVYLDPDDRRRILVLKKKTGGGGGSGDVSRSGSTADNRLVRWNGTGASVQTSTWSLDDDGRMTATVSNEDDKALSITAGGAATFGVFVDASGAGAVGLQGQASNATSYGVWGIANVSGAVAVRAQAQHASAIILQLVNAEGKSANLGFLGTDNRNINFQDAAGTVAFLSDITASGTTDAALSSVLVSTTYTLAAEKRYLGTMATGTLLLPLASSYTGKFIKMRVDVVTSDAVMTMDSTAGHKVLQAGADGYATTITFRPGNHWLTFESIGTAWVLADSSGNPRVSEPVVVTVDIDWSKGDFFTHALTADVEFTFSNVGPGQAINMAVTNTVDNWTVTWPASVVWPGGVVPIQTTGVKRDRYTFISDDGTIVDGSAVQDFDAS